MLTSESATAPLKAFAALAMRMRSLARMGRSPFRLRTPKEWTSLSRPRCTMAITPGGPPFMATRSPSAASAPLAFSLPKATVLPARYGTETIPVAKAVCLRKRLLLMIVVLRMALVYLRCSPFSSSFPPTQN